MEQKALSGLPLDVKATVAKVDSQAKVILFGSRARGDYHADSDWDFLILTQKEASRLLQDQIREMLYELELDQEQVITSIIESEEIWKRYQETELYRNVLREGIEIISPKAA